MFVIYYPSDKEPHDWVAISKHEYAYDTKGNMTMTTISYSYGEGWMIKNKDEYAYDVLTET